MCLINVGTFRVNVGLSGRSSPQARQHTAMIFRIISRALEMRACCHATLSGLRYIPVFSVMHSHNSTGPTI